MKRLLLLALCFLAGCSMFPKKDVAPAIAVTAPVWGGSVDMPKFKTTVDIDPRLLQDCKPFPDTPIDTPLDLLESRKADAEVYIDCKNNHAALVDTVKKAFNIKDQK